MTCPRARRPILSPCMHMGTWLTLQPGDRVVVTGVYRAQPLRTNPRMRNVKSVYRSHVDVLHFQKQDGKRQQLYEAADDDETRVKIFDKGLENRLKISDFLIIAMTFPKRFGFLRRTMFIVQVLLSRFF